MMMTAATIQSDAGKGGVPRASLLVLSAGLLVSAVVNLGWVVGAGTYLGGGYALRGEPGKPIKLTDDAIKTPPPMDRDKPLTLGREEAKRASITWLGVVENPVEGDAPESEVEQAAFTTREGNAERTAAVTPSPQTQAVPPMPELQPQPEPATEAVEQTQAQEQSPPAPELQSPELAAKEPVEIEPTPVEREVIPEREEPAVVIETRPEQEQEPGPQQPQPAAVEPDAQTPPGLMVVEVEPERVDELAPPNDDPAPQPEVQAPSELMGPTRPAEAAVPAEQAPASQPAPAPTNAGKEGVVSERESTASILKRAIKVDAKKLNQPIAGKGLEIVTVDPKFPASVRFTQLPRNPVVLIRFNASGRVAHVAFLRDEVKKKVYDTGSRAVDEPLLNAIYQWRAKGVELERLDPDDPESTIEISMTIIFRDEGSDP